MRSFFIWGLLGVTLSACISRSEPAQVAQIAPASPAQTESHSKAVENSVESAAATGATTLVPANPNPVLKAPETSNVQLIKLAEVCEKGLAKFSGKTDAKLLRAACEKVQVLPGCESVQGTPIYHYDRKGERKQPANILVFSLIHGDETPAGSVGRFWMERLESIEPRNNWRVVPVLNPDGVVAKTRTNANKVDINRNFPTKDWNEKALSYWKKDSKSNPRRFPGNLAASEPETACALRHLEDYKPDFVVSVHTPLNVLDYDGPKVKPPKFNYLPWKSLGHYPGSLGRYMWFERKVPVLTMELKEDLPASNEPWLQLQDIIGVLVSLEEMKKPQNK